MKVSEYVSETIQGMLKSNTKEAIVENIDNLTYGFITILETKTNEEFSEEQIRELIRIELSKNENSIEE